MRKIVVKAVFTVPGKKELRKVPHAGEGHFPTLHTFFEGSIVSVIKVS